MSMNEGAPAQEPVLGQAEGSAQAEQSQAAAGEGQERTEQTPQEAGQYEQEPQFVTRADAEKMVQNALNQARSYADKGRVRAEKAAQEAKQMVEQMRELGQNISDEDADKIIQNAKLQAIEAPDPDDGESTDGNPTVQMTPAQEEYARGLYRHDIKMQGKHGVAEFQPDDPELKEFKITGDPAKDEAMLDALYAKKAARLSSGNQETNTETESSVRVPSSNGQQPNFIAENASQYWKRAHRK